MAASTKPASGKPASSKPASMGAGPKGQLYLIERTLRRRDAKPGVKPGAKEPPSVKRQRADGDAPIDLRYPAHPADEILPPPASGRDHSAGSSPLGFGYGFGYGFGEPADATAFDLVAMSLEDGAADGATAFQVEEFDTPSAKPRHDCGCRARSLSDDEDGAEDGVEAAVEFPPEPEEDSRDDAPAEYVFPEAASLDLGDDAETRRFNEDLKAILSGQKSHPSVERSPPPRPPDWDDDDASSSAAPSPAPPSTAFGHEIFDRLGASMSRATTFDLGSMAIEQSMDEFDRRMAFEERPASGPKNAKPAATAPAALALSDLDFAEDLSLIMASSDPAEAQPTPAQAILAAATPASGETPS